MNAKVRNKHRHFVKSIGLCFLFYTSFRGKFFKKEKAHYYQIKPVLINISDLSVSTFEEKSSSCHVTGAWIGQCSVFRMLTKPEENPNNIV